MSWLKTLKPVFFVRSLEPFFCPCCHGEKATVIGSRNRQVIEARGDLQVKILRIRRLKCNICGRMHHELPDIVIPYKRHASESIEAVLEETTPVVVVEESTIRRWKCWFNGITCHLLGVLYTMIQDNAVETTPFPGTQLQRLRKYVDSTPGWLAQVVQNVVKKNHWIQTRSAFYAG